MIHMFSYGCKGMLSGLRNKRVMIFGGSGFVGSYFEQRLAAQEAIVSIFSRLSVADLEEHANIKR